MSSWSSSCLLLLVQFSMMRYLTSFHDEVGVLPVYLMRLLLGLSGDGFLRQILSDCVTPSGVWCLNPDLKGLFAYG